MKRRVIAIAVVVAAVTVVGMSWEPLYPVVMLKKVLDTSEPNLIKLKWVWRWGENRGRGHGPNWELYTLDRIVSCIEADGGSSHLLMRTDWGSDGQIFHQFTDLEHRTSPPWSPHSPLIDLSEFEE